MATQYVVYAQVNGETDYLVRLNPPTFQAVAIDQALRVSYKQAMRVTVRMNNAAHRRHSFITYRFTQAPQQAG